MARLTANCSASSATVWAAALNGVLLIVLGFLIADSLPSSAAWAIGLLVGIDLIFWGVRSLVATRLLKPEAQA
ncbi:MAG: hypothetical protein ACXVUE_20495 [Solirubrobacteraceae bacterium]